MADMRHTFRKAERLCSRKVIEDLFGGGAMSFAAFPLRAVWKRVGTAGLTSDSGGAKSADDSSAGGTVGFVSVGGVQVMMSVSKRRFRHAVDRNRAKRQMREAYRLNKGILAGVNGGGVAVAFVWLSDAAVESGRVHRAMRTLLHRIEEAMRA